MKVKDLNQMFNVKQGSMVKTRQLYEGINERIRLVKPIEDLEMEEVKKGGGTKLYVYIPMTNGEQDFIEKVTVGTLEKDVVSKGPNIISFEQMEMDKWYNIFVKDSFFVGRTYTIRLIKDFQTAGVEARKKSIPIAKVELANQEVDGEKKQG